MISNDWPFPVAVVSDMVTFQKERWLLSPVAAQSPDYGSLIRVSEMGGAAPEFLRLRLFLEAEVL